MKIAAYQAPLLACGSTEAIDLIRDQVRINLRTWKRNTSLLEPIGSEPAAVEIRHLWNTALADCGWLQSVMADRR